MKKIILFTSFFAFSCTYIYSKSLQALLSYSTFYSPGKGPYIETYLSVSGNTVVYKKISSGKYQGAIEVTLTFSQKEEIKYADKYHLKSPEVTDTANINFNFLDQQRISLAGGEYTLGLTISDLNGSGNVFESRQTVKLDFPEKAISISDIEVIESYKKSESPGILTKSGYDLIPYLSGNTALTFPEEINSLKFYGEIYNTDAVLGTENFLVNYYIQEHKSKLVAENLRRFSKQVPKPVTVLLSEFSIEALPSGEYDLVVEVRSKNNDLLAFRELNFVRISQIKKKEESVDYYSVNTASTFVVFITSRDTLMEYIRCLRPLTETMEAAFADNQLKIADVKLMQQYFYAFWVKRDPVNPEQAWRNYYKQVEKVNTAYGTRVRRGYDTDRGRVYLQYGSPNSIDQVLNEPSSYPYEIWHYYKVKNQSNRKFVFYNPDLVTNDFTLLHSDASGEPHDSAWQVKLMKRNTQPRDMETQEGLDHFGGKANDRFKAPR